MSGFVTVLIEIKLFVGLVRINWRITAQPEARRTDTGIRTLTCKEEWRLVVQALPQKSQAMTVSVWTMMGYINKDILSWGYTETPDLELNHLQSFFWSHMSSLQVSLVLQVSEALTGTVCGTTESTWGVKGRVNRWYGLTHNPSVMEAGDCSVVVDVGVVEVIVSVSPLIVLKSSSPAPQWGSGLV